MNGDIVYKVLWVDDQNFDENKELSNFYGALQLKADNYNIELVPFDNWEEAEYSLRKNFEEYSAIILDVNCKIHKNDTEQEEFITAVLPSLANIFGEKRRLLPWYLLSAGTMSNFETVVNGARYQHSKHEEDWGTMLYYKDVVDGENAPLKLFENIQRVASDLAMNVVLYRHHDVFSYLGKNKLIDERARELMLRMLSALYYPEENIRYEYQGNPLRKVVEYIFRAARKHGLLAEECFDKNDHIILLDASRYMGGLNINCYEGKNVKYQTRWGNPGNAKDGGGGDAIFTSDIAKIVKNTINFSSSDSHTEEEKPYLIDEGRKEIFFSYVMQVAYFIKWFGKYVEDNPDVKMNKSQQKILSEKKTPMQQSIIPSISPLTEQLKKENIIGKTYLVTSQDGIAACGILKLSDELKNVKGTIRILDVEINNSEDKGKYPYIITKIENGQGK